MLPVPLADVASYMKATHANDKDPWNTGIAAYVSR